ncbi:phospholipase D-like domain-containing protein [Microbulbifer marinus]|uniref:Putative cardiolipin synthase n=1 Tax=Microbulbifer marinus TaxID=658218 RepID=A0A1H4BBL6_9GAMM|nr:phospholipase D family protein [Microbulbifer marinus]SEA45222.1 putative cardiolipin synthase [Microbulbifer marinus]
MEVALRQYPLLLAILLPLCLCACSGQPLFPDQPPRVPSQHLQPPADATLAVASRRLTTTRPGQSGVYPVTSAHNALAVRLEAIRAAESSIDIQYFIFRRDETGLLLILELLHAADRGVRVRFLLDDFTTGDAAEILAALQQHPNIEVRLFNPFPHKAPRPLEFFADFGRLQRRMHNKSFTVDNRVTFIGGRNLSNKYFGIDDKVHFGDLDLVAIGAVVPDIARQFDLYWNSRYSFPVQTVFDHHADTAEKQRLLAELDYNGHQLLLSDYGRSLETSTVLATLGADDRLWYWGKTRALYDPPQKVEYPPYRNAKFAGGELMQMILGAQRQLIIISPYLLPGDEYLQPLINAAQRGVDVHILTNSLASTDVVLVHGAYRKYRKPLLEAGIHLYELSSELKYKLDNWNGVSKSLLHAKAFVVDGEWLYVGSFNLDPRSILLNTELGAIINSPQLASKIAKNFTANVRNNAYQLRLDKGEIVWHWADGSRLSREPGASFWQRVGSRLSSWLPIEHLL